MVPNSAPSIGSGSPRLLAPVGFTDRGASAAAPPTCEDGLEVVETFCLQKATRFLEPPAHGVAALHGRRLRHSLGRRPGLVGGSQRPLTARHVEGELQDEAAAAAGETRGAGAAAAEKSLSPDTGVIVSNLPESG